MKQSFARLTMRFSEIGNTIRDSIKASSERVEYMCQKIHASQINTVELAQQRISGISRAIREKISGSIELKKKKIDAIFHNILHIKKNLIDEQHNRIEQLATSIINSVTTQELHYKAADEKRNLVYVFIVIIITLLVAFWYFSRKN